MKKANEYFNGVNLEWIKTDVIVITFVREVGLPTLSNCTSESVFDDFCRFCDGCSPISKQSFHKTLMSNYPLTSKFARIDGEVKRIIVLAE